MNDGLKYGRCQVQIHTPCSTNCHRYSLKYCNVNSLWWCKHLLLSIWVKSVLKWICCSWRDIKTKNKKQKKSNKLIKVEIFSYLSVMILQVFGNLIYLVFEAYSPHLLSVLFLQSCRLSWIDKQTKATAPHWRQTCNKRRMNRALNCLRYQSPGMHVNSITKKSTLGFASIPASPIVVC